MLDNFLFALNPIVLPFTVLLLLAVAYWILVMLGFLGMELFDIEFDAEMEVDGDPTAGGESVTLQTLKFFHVGEVPIMVIFTMFALTMWSSTYLTTYYLRDWDGAAWVPVLLIGPNVLLSLVITRFALLPFRTFFRSLNDGQHAKLKIVGQVCLITSSEVSETFGQAEIAQDGPPIVIHARSRKGDVLRKGDAGVVDSYCKEDNTYLVVPKRREG